LNGVHNLKNNHQAMKKVKKNKKSSKTKCCTTKKISKKEMNDFAEACMGLFLYNSSEKMQIYSDKYLYL
jgi:hypothetical protein